MDWKIVSQEEQLNKIIQESKVHPVVIFKHSKRCPVSRNAKSRLEDAEVIPGNTNFYYLDIWTHRPISDKIATVFNVEHKSPQILLIQNGRCVYNQSHSKIKMEEIALQGVKQFKK